MSEKAGEPILADIIRNSTGSDRETAFSSTKRHLVIDPVCNKVSSTCFHCEECGNDYLCGNPGCELFIEGVTDNE